MSSPPPTKYRILDPRSAVGRVVLASALAIGAAWLISLHYSLAIAVLGGWNIGGVVLGALSWIRIATFDEQRTAARAAADDPGRTAVYVLIVLTSAASLLAATVLVRHSRSMPAGETTLMLGLCLSTVALSWLLTQTAFTLRYAHLYYREDAEGQGGIDFSGGDKPCYGDFAYLAFTVGMCFQVSDTAITSKQIRRTVLLHAVLSFFYNTAILAFVLNLVFGRAA